MIERSPRNAVFLPQDIPRRARQRRHLGRNGQPIESSFNPPPYGPLDLDSKSVESFDSSAGTRCKWKPARSSPDFMLDSQSSSESDSDYSSLCDSGRRSYRQRRSIAPSEQVLDARIIQQRPSLPVKTNIRSDAERNSGYTSDPSNHSEYSDDEVQDDPPDYYLRLVDRYRTQGPVRANHSEGTKKGLYYHKGKWNEFCQNQKIDSEVTLRSCDSAWYKAYLEWRIKKRSSRVKKESTVLTYWKHLSMLYAESAGGWMQDCVLFDVQNWIHTVLTPKYGLDTSQKHKAGLSVDELSMMLNYHWIHDVEIFDHERLRAQIAAKLIIAGATATRPGALVDLRYKDVEFQLFPPLDGECCPRLVLRVDLRNIKRTAGKSEPKEFVFREDDMLLYDPLLLVQSLAFADQAFSNDIACPEHIYRLVVPPSHDRLRLPWKEEWLSRPIFRAVENIAGQVAVCVDKPVSYHKERGHLMRLGRSIGLEKALEWYDLRRGSGRRLNEELTTEERNQIMGHRQGDSKVYVRYYMSTTIIKDCQSICFGSAPQHDLVQLANRLVRHANAPTKLTNDQLQEVQDDPTLVQYRQKRMAALDKINEAGLTAAAAVAVGLPQGKTYEKYQKKISSLSSKLKRQRLSRAIREFHTSVDFEEIGRQLKGVKPSTILAPPKIEYELPERAGVAALFSKAADVLDREDLFPIRCDLIKMLSQLCMRRESPCRVRTKRKLRPTIIDITSADKRRSDAEHRTASFVADCESVSAKPVLLETVDTSKICPFCRWNDQEVGDDQRDKVWRLDSLARHIREIHLRRCHLPFPCPWKDCKSILSNAEHFAGHSQRGHEVKYPPAIIEGLRKG